MILCTAESETTRKKLPFDVSNSELEHYLTHIHIKLVKSQRKNYNERSSGRHNKNLWGGITFREDVFISLTYLPV